MRARLLPKKQKRETWRGMPVMPGMSLHGQARRSKRGARAAMPPRKLPRMLASWASSWTSLQTRDDARKGVRNVTTRRGED